MARTIASAPRGYVLGKSPDGPYLDQDGTPQDDIRDAEVHPEEIVARSMARRRNQQGIPGGTWEVVPAPAQQNAEDDDEPFDQAKANASYARLLRRPGSF